MAIPAFRLETGRAFNRFSDNPCVLAARPGRCGIRGTEDSQGRDSQAGSDMHQSRVIAQEDPASLNESHGLFKGRSAGEVKAGLYELLAKRSADLFFTLTPDQNDFRTFT